MTTTILHNILLPPANSFLQRSAGTSHRFISQKNINTDTSLRNLKMM